MADFSIKEGDLLPAIAATLDPTAGDLSGCTVTFLMRRVDADTVKVNAAAVVVDGPAQAVRYDWTGTDTDTAGTYDAEWQVTYPSLKTSTFPSDKYHRIAVVPDIA